MWIEFSDTLINMHWIRNVSIQVVEYKNALKETFHYFNIKMYLVKEPGVFFEKYDTEEEAKARYNDIKNLLLSRG